MIWQAIKRWNIQHARLLAYIGSAGFMTVWTTVRFFTQKTIFDLVGHQVLAQQLLHGGIAGAGVGVTNYLPKIVFLYVPLHLLPGSPRIKLLILTVIVNIATIVLLGLILERILRKFNVKAGPLLWIGVLWLAAIAGSVFWVQFTNSRNLEVVGGVLLLYLGICYLEQPSWQRLVALSLFASALFFADTLQLYMTALPLILYGVTIAVRNRSFQTISLLVGGLAAAYLGAKILFAVSVWLFSIHIIQNGGGAVVSLHSLTHGTVGSVKALVHLYSGGADAGKLREACNLIFLGMIVLLSVYTIWRKLLPKRFILLIGYILIVNIVVYIVSGQAENAGTERYIIMTAPALVLLLGGLQANWKAFRKVGLVVAAVLVATNGLFLTKALAIGSTHRFSKDDHLASIARYIQRNPKVLPYASMDTAISMAYLYGSDAAAPLPLSCNGSHLIKNDTFYSQTAYRQREKSDHTIAAIILDGSAITNVPNACSQSVIIAQLGEPLRIGSSDDGSTMLFYSLAISKQLHY